MSLRPRPGGDEDATADPRYNDATGGNVASTIQRASIENVKRGGEVFQRAASMETLKKGGETIVDATKTGMGALVDGSAAVIKCGSSIVSSTVESVRDIFTETGNNKVTEDKQDEVVYEKPQRFLPSPLRLTGSNMPSNSELSEAVSTLQRLVRDQSHEIASLRASIGGEPTEEYAASLEYVNEMSDKGEANVEMEMDLNTADAGDIANLYSFCVEGAVSSRSPLAVILMLISVTLLLLLQVVYAFAFNDSSSLMGYQQELPAFQDPLDVSLFYPSAVLPGTHVPLSNITASIFSLILLALAFKNDTEGTLLTVCPLEFLFLPTPHAEPRPNSVRKSRVRRMVGTVGGVTGKFIICLFLQIHWTCRAILLPVLAGLGTASAFVGSKNAQDIVLNSVAIGFVFELDDFLYSALLNEARRHSYENKAPRPTSPLTQESGKRIVSNWCWICYAVDLAFVVSFYVGEVFFKKEKPLTIYLILRRFWSLARVLVLVMAQIHLAVTSGRLQAGVKKSRLIVGTTLMAVGMVAICVGTFALEVATLETYWGYTPMGVLFDPEAFECAMDRNEGAACTQMHLQPGIYDKMWATHEAMMAYFGKGEKLNMVLLYLGLQMPITPS